jgi:hypothetical protein
MRSQDSKPTTEIQKWDTTDIVRVSKVTEPMLDVYLPLKKNTTGQAVVI